LCSSLGHFILNGMFPMKMLLPLSGAMNMGSGVSILVTRSVIVEPNGKSSIARLLVREIGNGMSRFAPVTCESCVTSSFTRRTACYSAKCARIRRSSTSAFSLPQICAFKLRNNSGGSKCPKIPGKRGKGSRASCNNAFALAMVEVSPEVELQSFWVLDSLLWFSEDGCYLMGYSTVIENQVLDGSLLNLAHS